MLASDKLLSHKRAALRARTAAGGCPHVTLSRRGRLCLNNLSYN